MEASRALVHQQYVEGTCKRNHDDRGEHYELPQVQLVTQSERPQVQLVTQLERRQFQLETQSERRQRHDQSASRDVIRAAIRAAIRAQVETSSEPQSPATGPRASGWPLTATARSSRIRRGSGVIGAMRPARAAPAMRQHRRHQKVIKRSSEGHQRVIRRIHQRVIRRSSEGHQDRPSEGPSVAIRGHQWSSPVPVAPHKRRGARGRSRARGAP